mmetsp:Transcript_4267/g.4690  ORF Transcript_4267/g.4690 Transcript_4267/m.4690 type:complete len:373 (+) Transcript_4267:132-1250(+)|eukprot:CAMPEP_0194153388 /NCGR_PEP_ID=MMETSP0152-20130528/56248_1 /TAXON_ID=1049557 /ORGANISM="Thalassiothrix antarctica, Strain L6-D1" /LENGTH=372 /DNA_ID=CAMNT_0038858639 /DNA_START=91 /DNA_END=1209 /DNA_ORIENTATION=+
MNISNSFEDEDFYDVQEASPSTNQMMMMNSTLRSSSNTTFDRDELEKCGHWLVSIPRDDVMALRETPEYEDFLRVFEKLGHAHRSVLLATTNKLEGTMQLEHQQDSSFSFLQHMAVDDVVLRIMEFLECRSLIRSSTTCSRFRDLTHKSATQRTHQFGKERQLDHVFKLLRAKEEIDGSATLQDCNMPVPMLGLPKRVLVTEAGDPDFNGIYYCTGCDGNGYIFTKPRNDKPRRAITARSFITNPLTIEELEQPTNLLEDLTQPPSFNYKKGTSLPGELLRCIISKRFSNETILWYMSKEVETDIAESCVGETEVKQQFSFWAKLTVATDETSLALCGYPSPSDILGQQDGHAWQPLSRTESLDPPTVELID